MDETVRLPETDNQLPRLGFGVYQLRGQDCADACLAALKCGYRQIDSAQLYGNEADVGRSLRQFLEQAKVRREDLFITTKIGRHEGSVEKTYRSALRSVRRIAGEDGYVDLFLVHRPIQRREEVWVALERLLGEGKTRAIGVSNFRAEHLEDMKGYAKVWPPVVNQIEKNGILVQAYSPLARGQRMSDPKLAQVVARVRRREIERAEATVAGTDGDGRGGRAVTEAQVLIRWSLQKGFVPLVKSSDPARIEENANSFSFELDEEEMQLLADLDMGAQGALFPANCGRNRYVIEPVPQQTSERVQVLFHTDARHRVPLATPLAAMIKVPISWYHSSTHALFPDEAHSAIRRVFETPSSNPSKRYFCGFCGTPLSYWTERPHTEADYIHLTLASLCGEDLRDLEDLGLIPGLEETERQPVIPTTTTVIGRETRGVPWFESMIDGTRLGNLRHSQMVDQSRDGKVRVEWEIVEWTDADDGQTEDVEMTSNTGNGKRKLGERDDADAALEGLH
ncbi:aldo/keto reductase [Colletotrichum camelliae]|nr:aldo/keto reductase [Colletotrichum camelliae]